MGIRRGKFNLSIRVKKERAGINDRQFACWTEADRQTGRDGTESRRKAGRVCVWVVVVVEEIARHRHHHQIRTRERKRNRGIPESYQNQKGWVISSGGGRQTFGGIDTWWCANGHAAICAQAPATTAFARGFTNRVKAPRPRR
jgi:hypothetical protein